MKGFNINGNASAQDVIDAAANGSRLLRYQILPGLNIPVDAWMAHLGSAMAHLDQVVVPNLGPQKLILDLHSAPGGMKGRKLRIFSDVTARAMFLQTWATLVNHFKGYPPVLGYGILNEPAGSGKEVKALMVQTHELIRSLDKQKTILVTCPHSKPSEFKDTVHFSGDPNTIAEVHFYEPMGLTHQGMLGYKKGKKYPTSSFNKKHLTKAMSAILKYQQRTGAQILVGEFSISAMADAETRGNYIRDCLALFDQYGWHWCFHAWREGPGSAWSPEGVPQVMGALHQSLGNQ